MRECVVSYLLSEIVFVRRRIDVNPHLWPIVLPPSPRQTCPCPDESDAPCCTLLSVLPTWLAGPATRSER